MTAYELMRQYNRYQENGHYFDRDTLKFFGERISEMRVLKDVIVLKDCTGENHTCYILSSLQRNHPIKPTRHYTYFDIWTFEQIFPGD